MAPMDNRLMRPRPSGNLFDPRRLGSLALWLDAIDSTTIVLNGTTVSQWSDKSGFGRHATQGTASAQPSYAATGLLGLPALTVTGTQFLATASFALDDPLSVYAVASLNAAASNYRRLIHGGSEAKDQLMLFGALNGNFTTFFGNGTSWNDVAANSPATSVVGASVLAVANGDGIATPYVNGVAQNTKTGTMAAINDGVLICGSFVSGSAQRWWGAVSEVLVYSAFHSQDQVRHVTDALKAKWGVT